MGKGEFHEGEEKSAKRVVRKLVVWTGEQLFQIILLAAGELQN